MKFKTLFDLQQSADDLLFFFDGVTNPDQLVSRLDRLKRQAPSDLFDVLESLRLASSATLDDSLELGGALSDSDMDSDDLLDSEGGLNEPDFDLNLTPPVIPTVPDHSSHVEDPEEKPTT